MYFNRTWIYVFSMPQRRGGGARYLLLDLYKKNDGIIKGQQNVLILKFNLIFLKRLYYLG